MDSYTDHLFRKTVDAIQAEANEVIQRNGLNPVSLEQHREGVGRARGLMRAIEILKEVEGEMRKGED